MFDNEDDFMDQFFDEDDIAKLQRLADKKIIEDKKRYIRNCSLYEYFSVAQVTGEIMAVQSNILPKLRELEKFFITYEEYEKCANIRDWIQVIMKKPNKDISFKKPITF